MINTDSDIYVVSRKGEARLAITVSLLTTNGCFDTSVLVEI